MAGASSASSSHTPRGTFASTCNNCYTSHQKCVKKAGAEKCEWCIRHHFTCEIDLNRARRYVPVKKAVVAASSSSSSSVELSPEPESESEESPERRPRRGRRGMRVSASASKMMDMGHEIRGAGEEVPLARLDKGKQRATVYDDESMEDGDVLMEKGDYGAGTAGVAAQAEQEAVAGHSTTSPSTSDFSPKPREWVEQITNKKHKAVIEGRFRPKGSKPKKSKSKAQASTTLSPQLPTPKTDPPAPKPQFTDRPVMCGCKHVRALTKSTCQAEANVIGFATEQHKYNSIRTMDTTVHEMSLGDFEYMFGILAFSAATPEKACDFRIYGLLPEMGEFMAELIELKGKCDGTELPKMVLESQVEETGDECLVRIHGNARFACKMHPEFTWEGYEIGWIGAQAVPVTDEEVAATIAAMSLKERARFEV